MSNPSYSFRSSSTKSQRWFITVVLISIQTWLSQAVHVAPRHCRGGVKHLHLSVGKDPSTQMTISFASAWSEPGIEAPIAGVHLGTSPNHLDRFVGEHEFPVTYVSGLLGKAGHHYYSPFQHHITIDNLEPNTTYYYIAVVGDRRLGIDNLRDTPLKDHPSQHQNLDAENKIMSAQEQISRDNDEGSLRHALRRLAPPPYDGHNKACLEGFQVRSFRTAPLPGSEAAKSATFAIIGDLGQFDHSKETLVHMAKHGAGIDAVVLVGDIAYTEYDHRRWDTFFDFLDDYSIFDQVPLQVAIGNHDIDKQENGHELFQAYEARFRMPQVYPPEIGTFDGPAGLLNMDAPPYPLPYEWGNAYYFFDYGPAKHIVLSAYSNMNPGSKQYIWLISELLKVDRNITPWVLVTIHVPIYNTFGLHLHDLQIKAAKEHLEPLFVQYHVNVVFTGHIHAYLRTANVAMDEVTETGPLHITIGAGGRNCDAPFKSEEPEPWVVQRDASIYGYGKFQIFNATHAEWRWIHLSASDNFDYNRVKGNDDIHLPQLDHDEHILENQYFLAQR